MGQTIIDWHELHIITKFMKSPNYVWKKSYPNFALKELNWRQLQTDAYTATSSWIVNGFHYTNVIKKSQENSYIQNRTCGWFLMKEPKSNKVHKNQEKIDKQCRPQGDRIDGSRCLSNLPY